MSLFICDKCHCIDNTARKGNYWRLVDGPYRTRLCEFCYTGKWHNVFPYRKAEETNYAYDDFIYIPKELLTGDILQLNSPQIKELKEKLAATTSIGKLNYLKLKLEKLLEKTNPL